MKKRACRISHFWSPKLIHTVTAKPKGCYPGPRPGGFLGIEPKATVTDFPPYNEHALLLYSRRENQEYNTRSLYTIRRKTETCRHGNDTFEFCQQVVLLCLHLLHHDSLF